ncbi:ureidoglycolate lyase [Jannaschia formosa]|uniref:ureidoglycolate lyase n=1 Tax=Jannaschia formosa TaxID=2259592 RepID=UPI000E1B7B8E|nr:ureidoglycolate lyase [Jannaschia formosa]TFL15937.1 ureidoglycolate hydrolase [Jannaschia formosa]
MIPAVKWITETEFAPFGTVLRHPGGAGRHYIDAAIEDMLPQARPRLWINHLSAVPGDIRLEQIERHPHSAQSFLPLASVTLLTAVCPTLGDSQPDIGALEIFLLPPGTGITYRRGTWHHGLISLDRDCDVAVLMGQREDGQDTEFHSLPEPVHIPRNTLR